MYWLFCVVLLLISQKYGDSLLLSVSGILPDIKDEGAVLVCRVSMHLSCHSFTYFYHIYCTRALCFWYVDLHCLVLCCCWQTYVWVTHTLCCLSTSPLLWNCLVVAAGVTLNNASDYRTSIGLLDSRPQCRPIGLGLSHNAIQTFWPDLTRQICLKFWPDDPIWPDPRVDPTRVRPCLWQVVQLYPSFQLGTVTLADGKSCLFSVCMSIRLSVCLWRWWNHRSLLRKGDPPAPRKTWWNCGETRGGVLKKWTAGQQQRQYLWNT